jgi:hypothetical protein
VLLFLPLRLSVLVQTQPPRHTGERATGQQPERRAPRGAIAQRLRNLIESLVVHPVTLLAVLF